MAKIKIKDREIICRDGDVLFRVLREEGILLESPCSGRGTCGKCKIRVLEGEQPPLAEEEKRLLGQQETSSGVRLACMLEIKGNMTVALLSGQEEGDILGGGYMPDFAIDEGNEGYGAAVDIGTTTVALTLVDLSSGRELAEVSGINAQRQYGADVLTRISYEYEQGEAGIKSLKEAIVDQLNEMLKEVCRKADIRLDEVRKIAVAANCAMTHMLVGEDARPIGRAPFKPVFTEALELPAASVGLFGGSVGPCGDSVGLCEGEGATLYCLPQVSGYIGGDIVAGVHVCGLAGMADKNTLFIDIGTNGEIVFCGKGRLLSCSCAAGPALEGMNISHGMRAAKGGVDEVRITEEGVKISVIGGGAPQGICGSGILAAVRELVRAGLVKKNGAFVKLQDLPEGDPRRGMIRMNGKKREFVLSEEAGITVSQSDVRQVQLAKGAIRSGIETLLRETGTEAGEVEQILIAGQFGAFLSEASLTGTGLLPGGMQGRIRYMGNTSKSGALMMLLSEKARKEAGELAGRMEYIELAKTSDYERIFAESMTFF